MRSLSLFLGFGVLAACSGDVSITEQANVAPGVVIETPDDLSLFTEIETIEFRAAADDANGLEDIVGMLWESNIDGELGSGEDVAPDEAGLSRLASTLSIGVHTITVQATDAEGLQAEDSITVTVEAAAQMPLVEISSPNNFQAFDIGATIQFFGSVSDPNQGPDTLGAVWTVADASSGNQVLSSANPPSGTGATTAQLADAPLGDFTVRLTVTDDDSNTDYAEIFIRVEDPAMRDDDNDGWTPGQGDCDDGNADRYPGNPEVCDGIDNDCNGVIDDKDLDSDLHVDDQCTQYQGAMQIDDCNDGDETIYTGAPELEDGLDNDCNGILDDGTPSFDADGDCYCPGTTCTSSSNSACASLATGDCNDTDADISPADVDGDGASACAGDCDDTDATLNIADVDNDNNSTCDGDCDDDDASLSALDLDGDTFSTCDGDCDDDSSACGSACFPGNTAADVCDGYDQDCDTNLDEDPNLLFYRDGDGDGWSVTAGAQTTCTDPDGSGIGWVSTLSNPVDCDDGNAALNHDDADNDGFSTCENDCDDDDATLDPEDADNDSFSTCDGDCDDTPGSGATTNPDASDDPDDNYIDSNCDGLDGDMSLAILVSTSGSNSSTCGDMRAPCQTLSYAAGRADTEGVIDIYVQAGTYPGPHSLSGRVVQVYGGFDSSWVRDDRSASGHDAVFTGGYDSSAAQYLALKLDTCTMGLHNLSVQGPNASGTWSNYGRSSYAVHAYNSVLTIDGARVVGGNGTAGNAGSNGSNATQTRADGGNNGSNARGNVGSTCSTSRQSGGSRGTSSCGSAYYGGSGGSGGSQDSQCTIGLCAGGACNATSGANGGNATTYWSSSNGYRGGGGGTCENGAGGDGRNGRVSDGSGGNGGQREGELSGRYWRATRGGSGTTGSHGTGGGGGGGSGGCDTGADDMGAGGGGGGGGGCRATVVGTGGYGGGSSFGVFGYQSTLTVTDTSITRGAGGNGGRGGNGGLGQPGGNGGSGGSASGNSARGGDGGDGAHGGHAGPGGGGGGGGSYGIFHLGGSLQTLGNSYVAGSAGTGGTRGTVSGEGTTVNATSGDNGEVRGTRTCSATSDCGNY
ncbi:MAG: hypothetical protein KC912_18565 [Proteobacteria bacterium]|nr:hypothetical protein [Pseudomonadota bacterium]